MGITKIGHKYLFLKDRGEGGLYPIKYGYTKEEKEKMHGKAHLKHLRKSLNSKIRHILKKDMLNDINEEI